MGLEFVDEDLGLEFVDECAERAESGERVLGFVDKK